MSDTPSRPRRRVLVLALAALASVALIPVGIMSPSALVRLLPSPPLPKTVIDLSTGWTLHDDDAAAPAPDGAPSDLRRLGVDMASASRHVDVSHLAGGDIVLGARRATDGCEFLADGVRADRLASAEDGPDGLPSEVLVVAIPPTALADGDLALTVRCPPVAHNALLARLHGPAVRGPVMIGPRDIVERTLATARGMLDRRVRDLLAMAGWFLFLIGAYHALVWWFRRDQRMFLWFGLIGVCMGVGCVLRAFSANAGVITIAPGLAWSLSVLLTAVTFALALEVAAEAVDRTLLRGTRRVAQITALAAGVFAATVGVVLGDGARTVLIVALVCFAPVASAGIVWHAYAHRNGRFVSVAVLVLVTLTICEAVVLFASPGTPTVAMPLGTLASAAGMAAALARKFTGTLSDLDLRHAQLMATHAAVRRFLPAQFLDLLGKGSIEHITRGDHVERVMSVLFVDVRGFTTLAERLGPRATFELINGYVGYVEPVVHLHGGFINQFYGDGIMAIFPHKPDDAVAAAIGMQAALAAFNAEQQAHGRDAISVGVGINTGSLMLGTIGGATRLNASVVSDAVNTAARLEGMTKLYGARVLLGGATVDGLVDPAAFKLRRLDRAVAKGRAAAMRVAEVLDAEQPSLREAKQASLANFEAGLAAYDAGEVATAEAAFARCVEHCAEDGAARVLRDRCRAYLALPAPAVPWDPIARLSEK